LDITQVITFERLRLGAGENQKKKRQSGDPFQAMGHELSPGDSDFFFEM
jgi:hypothetical protein